jgi:hypothetical protein
MTMLLSRSSQGSTFSVNCWNSGSFGKIVDLLGSQKRSEKRSVGGTPAEGGRDDRAPLKIENEIPKNRIGCERGTMG